LRGERLDAELALGIERFVPAKYFCSLLRPSLSSSASSSVTP
jgi:hypothetical protein